MVRSMYGYSSFFNTKTMSVPLSQFMCIFYCAWNERKNVQRLSFFRFFLLLDPCSCDVYTCIRLTFKMYLIVMIYDAILIMVFTLFQEDETIRHTMNQMKWRLLLFWHFIAVILQENEADCFYTVILFV